ncbi:MAG: Tim44 domain-containing protein [Burkholderiales bacterium]
MKFITVVLTLFMAMASMHADAARRMGGGTSFGQQSGNVTQREATRPAPGATPNAAPSSAPAAAAPRRPWGAMLGGLAAGLGLAWLAHSLGFGAEFGQILMFGLLAMLAVGVIGYFMRRRTTTMPSPYAFGGGGGSSVNPGHMPQYNPAKVGNDASARPWEQTSTAFDSGAAPRSGVRIGSSLVGGNQNWFIPADFDVQGFVAAAKDNFISLQAAWDRADIPALRAMMTDSMLHEIQTQLAERGQLVQGPNSTEVVMLEAQLLGIEDLGEGYMASIEFSGMIREEAHAAPNPFREVWNMTKPKTGGAGWLVAGVQALQ